MNMRSLGVGTQEECGLRLCSQIKVHESSHRDSSAIYFGSVQFWILISSVRKPFQSDPIIYVSKCRALQRLEGIDNSDILF